MINDCNKIEENGKLMQNDDNKWKLLPVENVPQDEIWDEFYDNFSVKWANEYQMLTAAVSFSSLSLSGDNIMTYSEKIDQ